MAVDFYQKLVKARENKKRPFAEIRHRENDVLSQLMVLAFTNPVEPDSLPKSFVIKDVSLNSVSMEQIFKKLKINAEVQIAEPIKNSNGNIDYLVRLL